MNSETNPSRIFKRISQGFRWELIRNFDANSPGIRWESFEDGRRMGFVGNSSKILKEIFQGFVKGSKSFMDSERNPSRIPKDICHGFRRESFREFEGNLSDVSKGILQRFRRKFLKGFRREPFRDSERDHPRIPLGIYQEIRWKFARGSIGIL